MASDERQQAKASASEPDVSDPDFSITQADALRFRLEEMKERNSHNRAMHAASMGSIGKVIGDTAGAPNAIAVIVAIISLLIAIGCYFAAATFPEKVELWSGHAEKAIGTAVAMAAYLFGRTTASK